MTNSLWNLKAKLYRSMRDNFPINFILKKENRRLEFILRSLDLNGKTVIDLGTGTGNVLHYVADARVIIGIDYADSMLQMARQSYPDARLLQANVIALPIASNSVELVTAIGLSEYLRQIDALFNEVSRILKDNGFLVLTFSPYGIWTRLRLIFGHRIYPRTVDDVVAIARRKRFQVVKNSYSLMQGQVLFQKI